MLYGHEWWGQRMKAAWLGTQGRWLAALLCFATAACEVGEEWRLVRVTNSLEIGLAESEVGKRLGPPTDSGTKFYLGQEQGFEAQYREAAASTSTRYLFWHGGVDLVCAVGLDPNSRVAFRACGGT